MGGRGKKTKLPHPNIMLVVPCDGIERVRNKKNATEGGGEKTKRKINQDQHPVSN